MSTTVTISAGGGLGVLGALIYALVHWWRKRRHRRDADVSQNTKPHNEKEE